MAAYVDNSWLQEEPTHQDVLLCCQHCIQELLLCHVGLAWGTWKLSQRHVNLQAVVIARMSELLCLSLPSI